MRRRCGRPRTGRPRGRHPKLSRAALKAASSQERGCAGRTEAIAPASLSFSLNARREWRRALPSSSRRARRALHPPAPVQRPGGRPCAGLLCVWARVPFFLFRFVTGPHGPTTTTTTLPAKTTDGHNTPDAHPNTHTPHKNTTTDPDLWPPGGPPRRRVRPGRLPAVGAGGRAAAAGLALSNLDGRRAVPQTSPHRPAGQEVNKRV